MLRFQPTNLEKSVGILKKLTEEQFRLLQESVAGPKGFAQDTAHRRELAEKLGLEAGEMWFVFFSRCAYFTIAAENQTRSRDGESRFTEFMETTGLSENLGIEGSKRLQSLVAINATLERLRKLRSLQTGTLVTATDFVSTIELRPYFATNQTGIDGFIPVVIFKG